MPLKSPNILFYGLFSTLSISRWSCKANARELHFSTPKITFQGHLIAYEIQTKAYETQTKAYET